MNIDEAKLQEFMGRMMGHMTGATLCHAVWLGDELGLYRAMAGQGPQSSDAIATSAECHHRLVREWLDGQAAAGLVDYDSEHDKYELSDEAAMALAHENSPVFVARAMNAFASIMMDIEKVKKAFRGDGALGWGEHHECLFKGTEWFFRTGYKAHLPGGWIPAMDGVKAKLDAGARVADVGCGHGASTIAMAEAFPRSSFHGFDMHEPSIITSRKRADEAGVAERTKFEVASSTSYGGEFDLICFFDCFHDMGDPESAARHALSKLKSGGKVMLVEPNALNDRKENIKKNPIAAMMYSVSSSICVPCSLSQEGALGLGAQAGEARIAEILKKAGFATVRRVAETPINIILEASA